MDELVKLRNHVYLCFQWSDNVQTVYATHFLVTLLDEMIKEVNNASL